MTNWLNCFVNWIDARLPIKRTWDTHMGSYYAPKNFNFWYFFGVFSLLVLVNQLFSGIWLTMNYTPTAEGAFASVEYIMRDVPYGDIIRYLHSTGATAFFAVIYLHMFRGLMYGSYKAPRELIWIFGMFIYVALMAEAFLGYVLPWGQMSYWGAQVIVNLFGAIPYIGEDLVQWIRGDYLISGATLNRFFALHVVALPIVIIALVFLHILALHEVGSNNPDGVDIKKHKDENGVPLDGVRFHPYYTVHDLVGIGVFLFVFLGVVFFAPELGGYALEHANFEEANNLKTPEHIAPVWYFTPFYAILRAVTFDLSGISGVLTAKLLGFIAMALAIVILFFLPWLDKAKAKSVRYKGKMSRYMLILFAANFVILGILGLKSPTPDRTLLAQICTLFYFAYFFTMPFWTRSGIKSLLGTIVSIGFGLVILYVTFTGLTSTEDQSVNIVVAVFGVVVAAFIAASPWITLKDKELKVPERVTMKGMGFKLVTLGFIIFLALIVVPMKAVAASGGKCGAVPCETFEADLKDKESLQAGAKTFINYCMGCHSANFSRYERVADDLSIPHEAMLKNLVFSDQKIGDLMKISMRSEDSKKWLGATPPDLTLATRARSSSWLYTFLKNYYVDDSRPTGVNNLVFANVGMPHVFSKVQGLALCKDSHTQECHEIGEAQAGELTTAQFEKVVYDLVNFMTYLSEPGAVKRKSIGVFVFFFLAIFLIFAWLLNREYWKDIH